MLYYFIRCLNKLSTDDTKKVLKDKEQKKEKK